MYLTCEKEIQNKHEWGFVSQKGCSKITSYKQTNVSGYYTWQEWDYSLLEMGHQNAWFTHSYLH